jgi:hypothetical protein
VKQAAPDNEKLYNAAKLFKALGNLEIVRELGFFFNKGW